jgi:hypothetical protein
MGSTAGWQRSIALLFGEASKDGGMWLQISQRCRRQYEMAFANNTTPRNVRRTAAGQTGRDDFMPVTANHSARLIARTDGPPGRFGKDSAIGIEQSNMKAQPLVRSFDSRPIDPMQSAGNAAHISSEPRSIGPIGTTGDDNFSVRTDPASSSTVRFAAEASSPTDPGAA